MNDVISSASSLLLDTFDSLHIPALLIDKSEKVIACNTAAGTVLQYSAHDIAGQNIRFLITLVKNTDSSIHPGAFFPAQAAFPAGQKDAIQYESSCKRKDGTSFIAQVSILPCHNHEQRLVVLQEISGRQSTISSQFEAVIENSRLIKQLQNKMDEIELINELSSLINSSLSIGTIFRMMVSELRKIVDYNRASLLLYNEKDRNLIIFALDTEMKTVMKKGARAPIEGTSSGWVFKNNRPLINYDLRETEFVLDRKLLREGIRSTISIPLFYDRPLGVFNLDSTEPAKYSEKDLNVLVPVAKHISIALENALLFEQISKEKKEWEKTFDAITDMVWIEDGKQHILRANATLLSKTGFSSAEITEKICWELLDKIGIHQTDCLCADTIRTKQPSFRELKGTGRSIFHFWAYPLLDEEGQLYSIVHYLKDVTASKQLEQQLIRSEKLASLGTLVAGIAHEINNPLGIIAGYAEALLDRAKEPSLIRNKDFEDFPEYLETIHNEIFRCKGILRSLLDFARPSGGTFRDLDINELIKEVILLVNHKAKQLKHHIELKLNRDLPKIHADPGNLRQLFMNLIINSMYFTPAGGSIIITTEMDASGKDRDGIKVSVTDNGVGIPAKSLKRYSIPSSLQSR